jgi:PAS domain S-box-containing protein
VPVERMTMGILPQLFGPGEFMPHGYCYLWNPGLVWLHVISDTLIAASYFTILFILLRSVRKRRDLPFSWMFGLFGVFIVACGATHVMEVWNLWHAEYWLAGVLKAVTAVASVATAILLARLAPQRFQVRHSSQREEYAQSPHPRSLGAGLDLYGRRKDGSEFPVEISLSPLETGEGTLISSAIRDVTERKKLAEEFLEHEMRFRMLIDAVKDYAIMSLDADGLVTSWNTGAQRLNGYSSEEIIGQHMSRFYPQADTASRKPDRELQEAASAGRMEVQDWRVRKDGSHYWAEVAITAVHDSAGKLIGFVNIAKDITSRRDSEEQIRKLNAELTGRVEELATVNRELESFSYSVSHDLRAPLRHVDGFARILQEEYSPVMPPEAIRYLDRILEAATHMGQLIDGLLDLARIGRRELKRGPAQIACVVKQAIAELPGEAQERNIEWRIEPLPELNCDGGLLKLVFVNLLSNAVKFTRKRPFAVIEVGSLITDGQPTIFVRDNGVGFDPQYADKLFGVFQRLHRQEDFEGTGIGLATVQRIIRRHGGEIWAESQVNSGTTFFFTLGALAQSSGDSRTTEIKHA